MTLSLGFVLPVLVGFYADQKIGTRPVGLLIGMVIGFSVGVFSIVTIAKGPGSGPTLPSR